MISTTSSTTCGWRTRPSENYLDKRTLWRHPGRPLPSPLAGTGRTLPLNKRLTSLFKNIINPLQIQLFSSFSLLSPETVQWRPRRPTKKVYCHSLSYQAWPCCSARIWISSNTSSRPLGWAAPTSPRNFSSPPESSIHPSPPLLSL